MNISIKTAPSAATTQMNIIVLISPERRNEITIKVKKNMSAVPKSYIRKRQPMHATAKIMYLVRLRVD